MENNCQKRLETIAEKFKMSHKMLTAIGDETRQCILLTLLNSDVHGVRVGEITEKAHLSRPAASRHLRVLKEAGIVNVRREGTKNYYYLDAAASKWETLAELVRLVYAEIQQLGENDPRKEE